MSSSVWKAGLQRVPEQGMIWKGVQADRKMEPEVMRLDSLELGLCVRVCALVCVPYVHVCEWLCT